MHGGDTARQIAHLHLAQTGLEDVYFVEQVLARLGAIDPRLRAVIEMRVFEGLTGDEIAQQLGCSQRTVANLWTFAKRWLSGELAGASA